MRLYYNKILHEFIILKFKYKITLQHRYSIQAPQVSKDRLNNILAKNLFISSKESKTTNSTCSSPSTNTNQSKFSPTTPLNADTSSAIRNELSRVIPSDLPTPKFVRDIPLPPLDPFINRGPNCKQFTKISSNKVSGCSF